MTLWNVEQLSQYQNEDDEDEGEDEDDEITVEMVSYRHDFEKHVMNE